MKKLNFLIFFLFAISTGYTQNSLKGYVKPDGSITEGREIILTRLLPEKGKNAGEIIARGRIAKDGFFVFHDSVFTEKDLVYSIQVEIASPGKRVLDTTINHFRTFILSNRDSVRFNLGTSLFPEYSNSNEADGEWQKLKKYERQKTLNENFNPDNYLAETRDFTKDSLQILLVKLLGIQTLDEKQLLDRDIKENADFYVELLDKLKDSSIDPASYKFLENKIKEAHQELINQKYQISLALNFFGFTGIVGLLFLAFRMNKKSEVIPSVPLSKQEEKVKTLILEGKTNKEIAGNLFISISTVKTHTSNIYSKLNVSNRKELVLKHQNHTGTST